MMNLLLFEIIEYSARYWWFIFIWSFVLKKLRFTFIHFYITDLWHDKFYDIFHFTYDFTILRNRRMVEREIITIFVIFTSLVILRLYILGKLNTLQTSAFLNTLRTSAKLNGLRTHIFIRLYITTIKHRKHVNT